MQISQHDALIVVDWQNDFANGLGALPVPHAEELSGAIGRLVRKFQTAQQPALFTRCWHPADHCSFRDQGGQWPAHCVQESWGAMLAPPFFAAPAEGNVFSKGTEPKRDSYSGFGGMNAEGVDLNTCLQRLGIKRVLVCGLALDYCVKDTTLGAMNLGYEAVLVVDAMAAVNVKPGDGDRALQSLIASGAKVRTEGWVR
jgi:nicotinamidase/pyrazinamidase